MIDPYDPPHPDGSLDEEDAPQATVLWLDDFDDEGPADDERRSDFRPHLEDPA
jgi:hypothetical protein